MPVRFSSPLTYNILFFVLYPLLINGAIAAVEQPNPITIEADQAILKEKEGLSIYRGNVILKKGTLSLSASEITLKNTNGKLDTVIATGKPVHLTQKNTQHAAINAQANTIKFLANINKLLLLDQASLTQGKNKFAGERIEYDIKTDTVIAGGTEQKPQRVKVIIEQDAKPTIIKK